MPEASEPAAYLAQVAVVPIPRNVLKVTVATASEIGSSSRVGSAAAGRYGGPLGVPSAGGAARSKQRVVHTLPCIAPDPHDLVALQHAGILLFNRDPDAGLRHLLL